MEIQVLCDAESKRRLRTENLEGQFEFFLAEMVDHRSYIVAIDGGDIVGMVCFVDSSLRVPGALGVAYICTRDDRKRTGVSKRLVAALFELASQRNQPIAMTWYETQEGKLWLKPTVDRARALHPHIEFFERD